MSTDLNEQDILKNFKIKCANCNNNIELVAYKKKSDMIYCLVKNSLVNTTILIKHDNREVFN